MITAPDHRPLLTHLRRGRLMPRRDFPERIRGGADRLTVAGHPANPHQTHHDRPAQPPDRMPRGSIALEDGVDEVRSATWSPEAITLCSPPPTPRGRSPHSLTTGPSRGPNSSSTLGARVSLRGRGCAVSRCPTTARSSSPATGPWTWPGTNTATTCPARTKGRSC